MTTTDREAETRAPIDEVIAALTARLPGWPHEALLMVVGLESHAAHLRKMADDSAADAQAEDTYAEGRFSRGQASAFRIAAEGVERQLEWAGAKERVTDMLAASVAACPETQPAQSGEA